MKTKIVILLVAMSLLLAISTLTLNTKQTKASPGFVIITVQYADGCPRPGADVYEIWPSEVWLGITDDDGIVNSSALDPGEYYLRAYYDGSIFGPNEVYLYVNETGYGSATIQKDYEITAPNITILEPENTTYSTTSVDLNYTIYDFSSINWTGYSLDRAANVTITGNTTLADLSYDSHNIIVYANDTYGNMGASEKVYFTVKRQYTLTINAEPGGTTDPVPGEYEHYEGTVINVTAIPDAGYKFDYWFLDNTTYTINPIDVTMDMNHTLTANFSVLVHDIAVTNITFSKQNPSINETIFIYVTVINNGGFNETFDVSVNYTRIIDPLIGNQTITLEPGESITLNFTWTPTASGRYQIKAYCPIPYDINLSDNTKTIDIHVGSNSSSGGSDGSHQCLL